MEKVKFMVFDSFAGKIRSGECMDMFLSVNEDGTLNSYSVVGRNPVMVYIGLEDANGNEIYSGHIIESIASDGKPYRHIIKYDPDTASFTAEFINTLTTPVVTNSGITRQWIKEHNKLIVGNIYQNPELFK